jgi:hypothetical protein
MASSYFIHDFNILITVKFYKQTQWFQLIKYLRHTCHKSKFRLYYLQFVILQLSEVLILLYGASFFSFFLGISETTGMIFVCSEMYFQRFYVILRCIILEMLSYRYQHQHRLLKVRSKNIRIQHFYQMLRESQKNLYMLKEATDVFNDIFGWSTLLNIFSNSIRTLTFLDMFLRSEGSLRLSNDAGSIFNIVFHIIVILTTWV